MAGKTMTNERAKASPKKGGVTELRRGFTTGTCAAAASKAAAYALILERPVTEVDVALPGGGRAVFHVHEVEQKEDWALATVVKDAGDDPDVTNGAEIGA